MLVSPKLFMKLALIPGMIAYFPSKSVYVM
jgi:hypothetical protein